MKIHCNNCDWSGNEYDSEEIDDVLSRHAPDDILADGQCPNCGCLCYRAQEDSRWVTRDDPRLLSVLVDIESMATGYGIPITDPEHPWHATADQLRKLINEPDANRKPVERVPQPDDDLCPDCGCEDIEISVWVNVNTNKVTVSEDPVSYCYCPNCETEIYRTIERREFKRGRK